MDDFNRRLIQAAARQKLLSRAEALEGEALRYVQGTPYYSEPGEYGINGAEDGRGHRLVGYHTPTAEDLSHADQLRARATALRLEAERGF